MADSNYETSLGLGTAAATTAGVISTTPVLPRMEISAEGTTYGPDGVTVITETPISAPASPVRQRNFVPMFGMPLSSPTSIPPGFPGVGLGAAGPSVTREISLGGQPPRMQDSALMIHEMQLMREKMAAIEAENLRLRSLGSQLGAEGGSRSQNPGFRSLVRNQDFSSAGVLTPGPSRILRTPVLASTMLQQPEQIQIPGMPDLGNANTNEFMMYVLQELHTCYTLIFRAL